MSKTGTKISARAAVVEAERELRLARHLHRRQMDWLRGLLVRRRGALLVGGGLAAGVLVGLAPVRRWTHGGKRILDAVLAIAKTPLGPLAIGALLGKRAANAHDEPADT